MHWNETSFSVAARIEVFGMPLQCVASESIVGSGRSSLASILVASSSLYGIG